MSLFRRWGGVIPAATVHLLFDSFSLLSLLIPALQGVLPYLDIRVSPVSPLITRLYLALLFIALRYLMLPFKSQVGATGSISR